MELIQPAIQFLIVSLHQACKLTTNLCFTFIHFDAVIFLF